MRRFSPSRKISGARYGREGRPKGREAWSDHGRPLHADLPARMAGDIGIGEVLGCGRRGKRDDQGDCDHELFHVGSPRGWSVLAAERGRVRVREGLGHGGRGKGDDQGDGDQKLLHFKSPLASWLALRGSGLRSDGLCVRSERAKDREGDPCSTNTLWLSNGRICCTE